MPTDITQDTTDYTLTVTKNGKSGTEIKASGKLGNNETMLPQDMHQMQKLETHPHPS